MQRNKYLPWSLPAAQSTRRPLVAGAVAAVVTWSLVHLFDVSTGVELGVSTTMGLMTAGVARGLARIADRPAVAPIAGLRADYETFVTRISSGDLSGAVPLGSKLLAFVGPTHERKFLLTGLALCAEQAGDFEDAEELARLALPLPSTPEAPMDDALHLRLSFALAVRGSFDEATEHLALVSAPAELEVVAMRTRALIASKRAQHQDVDTLLAGRTLGLPLGDRSIALLERIREHAAQARAGAYRAPSTSEPVSEDVERWVRRAAPHLFRDGR